MVAVVGLSPPGLVGGVAVDSCSLTPVGTEDSSPPPSAPMYMVELTGSIQRVSVNPPQFGPLPPSMLVQLVTAGWPGKSVERALNSHENTVSETGCHSRPLGSEAL